MKQELKKIADGAAWACAHCGPLVRGEKASDDSTFVYGFNLAQASRIIHSAIEEARKLSKDPNAPVQVVGEEQPYHTFIKTEVAREYNPNYGDERVCKCGHTYGRHFDTYEYMYPCGCKYCECSTFVEQKEPNEKDAK